MSIIGKAICLFRERTGRMPVHKFGKIYETPPTLATIPFYGERTARVKQCSRCGFTVPVKTRKRKAAE